MQYKPAITSNYASSIGDPEPSLRRIAEAGFRHVMWAHNAWADYLYTKPEVDHVLRCLKRYDLEVVDLHCPTGREQRWGSPVEYQRLAGVELLKNRLDMASRLGCPVVVCHLPMEPAGEAERSRYWDRQRRTMDALQPFAVERGVRIALENTLPGNFDTIEQYLSQYGPDFLGLCYDSGHGAARVDWPGNGLERLEKIAHRTIDFHLHDNDGTDDQHLPLFAGVVDWPRLARVMPVTDYGKAVVPMEVGLKGAGIDTQSLKEQGTHDEAAMARLEADFLRQMFDLGQRFAALVAPGKSHH